MVGLATVLLFLTKEHQHAGPWGYSLDDSWIHATIARNLARGEGFSFNPGELTGGSTSPLFTLLLAGMYAIFGSSVWISKSLGIAAHVVTIIVAFRVSLLLVPRSLAIATLTATVTAVFPPLVWAALSGMEISIYILTVMLGFLWALQGRSTLAAAVWSLGVWIRPDGLLLMAMGIALLGRGVVRRLVVSLGILLPYLAFNLIVGQSPLPATVSVKAHLADQPAGQLLGFLLQLMGPWGIPLKPGFTALGSPLLPGLALAGGLLAWRRCPVLSALPALFPIAFGLISASPGPQFRYVLPLVPVVVLLAGVGLDRFRNGVPSKWRSSALIAASGLLLLPLAGSGIRMADVHGWNVQNINGMHRFLGERLQAMTAPSDTLATNDIGAIGFFSDRYIVDVAGLISPLKPLPEMLTTYRPKYLIVFPSWYSGYAHTDSARANSYFDDTDSTFRYWGLFGVHLQHNTIAARDRIFAFVRTPYRAAPPPKIRMYRH